MVIYCAFLDPKSRTSRIEKVTVEGILNEPDWRKNYGRGALRQSDRYVLSFSLMFFLKIKRISIWDCCLFTSDNMKEIRFFDSTDIASTSVLFSCTRSGKTFDGSRRNPCLLLMENEPTEDFRKSL